MKICIIGPGGTDIPPQGWGAVETLIWDLSETLKGKGHEVKIVNTLDKNRIISETNDFNPDFVHIQYDDHFDVEPYIKCNNIAITSHYGYLEQPNKYDPGYWRMFNGFLSLKRARIFALSQGIATRYVNSGFDPSRIKVVPNGVREDLFLFSSEPLFPELSIYLGKIEERKKQYLYSRIDSLNFVGDIVDYKFDRSNPRYLGPMSKASLYTHLTEWSNLVLLSDGEAHPLVLLEGMAAGLGLVISEAAAGNLDTSLPFIDVIPNERLHDISFVEQLIKENREKSCNCRSAIREYCINNFSWQNIVRNKYLPAL